MAVKLWDVVKLSEVRRGRRGKDPRALIAEERLNWIPSQEGNRRRIESVLVSTRKVSAAFSRGIRIRELPRG